MSGNGFTQPGLARLAALLSGIVAVGFMAWAGVVFSGWQDVRKVMFGMATQQARNGALLESLDGRVGEMLGRVDRHSTRPWHDEAGNHFSEMRSEIRELKRRTKGEALH